MDESARLLCHPFLLSTSVSALSLGNQCHLPLHRFMPHQKENAVLLHFLSPLCLKSDAFLKQLHVNDSSPPGELGCFVVLRHRDVC